jgi:hypothetical protein
MTAQTHYLVPLRCHPDTPCEVVESIDVCLELSDARELLLTYMVRGAIERLRIPPLAKPTRADGLWRHTCFEAFVAGKGTAEYCEFNFAPSGDWAAYAFRGYRDRGVPEIPEMSPAITVRCATRELDLQTTVRLDRLPPNSRAGTLRIGLAAVIENQDGAISYWAIRHPAGKPDFHRPDGFLLEVNVSVDAGADPAYNSKA